MRQILAWALVVAALGWGTAIVAAPLAQAGLVQPAPGGSLAPHLSGATYLIGALVCHQRPERSFHVAGAQLPVCARCAALYWGGALGLTGWLVTRSRRGGSTFARGVSSFALLQRTAAAAGGGWSGDRSHAALAVQGDALALRTLFARAIVILGVPIGVTLVTSALGVWDPPNAFRAMSSAPFGVAVGAVLAAAVLGDLR